VEPLLLGVLVLSVAAPARDPLLALLVPDLLVLCRVADALLLGEALPLGERLRLGQGLLARQLEDGLGEDGDRAVLALRNGKAEERRDERLRRRERQREEVRLAVRPGCECEQS
jgi:hypothetical protein